MATLAGRSSRSFLLADCRSSDWPRHERHPHAVAGVDHGGRGCEQSGAGKSGGGSCATLPIREMRPSTVALNFPGTVVLTERSVDTVDDGFPHLAEIGVSVTVTVLETRVRDVFELVSLRLPPSLVSQRDAVRCASGGTFDKSGPSPSAIVRCARTASRSFG